MPSVLLIDANTTTRLLTQRALEALGAEVRLETYNKEWPYEMALGNCDADMIMFFPGIRRRNDPQAAGHPEVDQQGAGVIHCQQKVFRAPPHPADAAALDHGQRFRNRLPQVMPAHDHFGHPPASHMRFDPAAGGFNFGKLRHWMEMGMRIR